MKKIYNELIVYKTKKFDDIYEKIELDFPMNRDFLNLLKKENCFPQEYYYIKNQNDFAFFIVYKMKLNIFTFGKFKLNIKIKVIGIPCSISENGYYTNNEKMMLEFIKTIKGPKLILNVKEPIKVDNIIIGKTLPTCIFDNNFKSIDEYMLSLRSSYRRRINKAIKNCKTLTIDKFNSKCSKELYKLYLKTYQKSSYKLEKLEPGFFDNVEADKIVFSKDKIDLGFVLLKKHQEKLYFMLCGMNYQEDTVDLYYFMLYNIIVYAIEHNCKFIDFGQTSEETKLKMGAQISQRYFYAHHTNIFLNKIVKANKNLLEYKYNFKKFRVYKKENYENIIDKTKI